MRTFLVIFLLSVVSPYALAQTPAQLPKVDPAAYLPANKPGPTITVSLATVSIAGAAPAGALQRLRAVRESASEANDLSLLINAAKKELTASGGGTIAIAGGGSIKTQDQLKHDTKF